MFLLAEWSQSTQTRLTRAQQHYDQFQQHRKSQVIDRAGQGQDSLCTVIGTTLFIARNGWTDCYTLEFLNKESARTYVRLTKMDYVSPEQFIILADD